MSAQDSPTLSVTLLGAGQEVGRSCCVLQYRGKTIVCDGGVHPAHHGMASLPFVDELDWSTVDALLITHFHLDHAAALTYIMEKTNFRDGKGKVYMTHATKAVYKFMMQDFVRMSGASGDPLFSALDLSLSMANIIPVSAHQQISPCPGVSFIPYHAGHVLGACMFMIDIAGLKILYTGDYSREEDRHLVKAEVPPARPDVLIIESTYGVQSLEGREEKEQMFTSEVHSIIRRGGHVLLPVFAMGRAQELLLILDEYWDKHPELHNVPVYYASSLAKKCMSVYQTYIHTMNANIRGRFERRDNPFVFKYISNLPHSRNWEKKIADGPPCVILASPGFLHNGMSRELLELWAPDPRNGVIITGYSVEGTMARDIVNEPDEIPSIKGGTIPRRLSVRYVSFSAHVDYSQNSEFIDLIGAQHIILVHGEQTQMMRLRAALQSKYREREEDVKIHTPRNLETLQLSFRGDRVAKAIGKLAANPPIHNSHLSGLLISKDFSYTLLDPSDLRDFTGLSTSSVIQKVKIAIGCGPELVRWHLEGMYGSIEDGRDRAGIRVMRVMGAVDVRLTGDSELTLEWSASASNDMVADSLIAILMGIDHSPASVKLTTRPHVHSHSRGQLHEHHKPGAPILNPITKEVFELQRLEKIINFLEAHFGEVGLLEPNLEGVAKEANENDGDTTMSSRSKSDDGDALSDENLPAIVVKLDEYEARIGLLDMIVRSSHAPLRRRVESVLEMALTTTASLSELYVSGDEDLRRVREEEEGEGERGGAKEAKLEAVDALHETQLLEVKVE